MAYVAISDINTMFTNTQGFFSDSEVAKLKDLQYIDTYWDYGKIGSDKNLDIRPNLVMIITSGLSSKGFIFINLKNNIFII
jgi:hypothetical protein